MTDCKIPALRLPNMHYMNIDLSTLDTFDTCELRHCMKIIDQCCDGLVAKKTGILSRQDHARNMVFELQRMRAKIDSMLDKCQIDTSQPTTCSNSDG